MNWIVKCNQLEKESKNVIYESCCKLMDFWENFINETINTGCNNFFNDEEIEKIIDKMVTTNDSETLEKLFLSKDKFEEKGVDKEEISSIFDEVIDGNDFSTFLQKAVIKAIDENENLLKKCINCYYDEIPIIKKCLYQMSEKCLPYIRNEKELYLMCKRISLFSRDVNNQFQNLNSELKVGFAHDFARCMDTLVSEKIFKLIKQANLCEYNIDEALDTNSDSNENVLVKKIFDHKEMEALAIKNGFVYKWSNGSHNIYEHGKSRKIVVIPAHKLGLGLSIKIQKQIQSNII